LIVIGTSNGCGRDHQVPCGGKDLLIAEFLPKLDIEIPPGILLADQAAHYKAISHLIYYPHSIRRLAIPYLFVDQIFRLRRRQ
jgi:hypothetical protein